MSKFIRWRVSNWRSCFLACRFPSEDEPDAFGSSSAYPLPIKNMVFELRECNKTSKKIGKNMQRNERSASSNHGSERDKNVEIIAMEGKSEEPSNWPCFHDEDYIVFCFKEGGQLDILDDDKSHELDVFESADTSPMHANVKKFEVDVKEMDRKSREDEERLHLNRTCICLTNEADVAPVFEGWKEGASSDTELPLEPEPRNQQAEEDIENHGIVSFGLGSSDGSNKSEGSAGSFSFPVLPWEWMGSPVHMPKSENLFMKKHKVAKFQCCKF